MAKINKKEREMEDMEVEKIKIEKDIPIPKYTRGPIAKYPFSKMEIGDSFFIHSQKQSRAVSSCSIMWARHFNKKNKEERKFSTRKQGKGYRCWRIK